MRIQKHFFTHNGFGLITPLRITNCDRLTKHIKRNIKPGQWQQWRELDDFPNSSVDKCCCWLKVSIIRPHLREKILIWRIVTLVIFENSKSDSQDIWFLIGNEINISQGLRYRMNDQTLYWSLACGTYSVYSSNSTQT